MRTWVEDVRLSLRGMRKNPGFTATAVLTLALGIGLSTVIVSVVNGTVSRAPALAESERLMLLRTTVLSQGIERRGVPAPDLADWRAQQTSFEDLAALRATPVDVSRSGDPERLTGAFVTAKFFRLLRVQPSLGRAFLPEEDRPGAPQVAVLTHDLWMRRYGGDPGILGATIRVDREPTTIVGVMPPEFRFPTGTDLWLALRLAPTATRRAEGPFYGVIGRLRDGVSPRRAQADMTAVAKRLEAAYPEANKGVGILVVPYLEDLRGTRGTELALILLAAVCLVLLIACSNVANLLLARVLSRSKEISVRAALGASRARLVRQFLVESLLLSACGILPGILLASAGVDLFNKLFLAAEQPLWGGEVRLDSTVLLAAVAIMLAASVISGLAPALYAARVNAGAALKDETHGMSGLQLGRLSRWIVVAEVALSYMLLVTAAIIVRTAISWATFDLGFSTDDVLTARVQLREQAYPDGASRAAFAEALQRGLEAVPGVRSAAVTDILPATSSAERRYEVEGRPAGTGGEEPIVGVVAVTPGFFETFGVSLLTGRDFEWRDGADALPVVIVNESLARREWPGQSPIGRRIRLEGEPDAAAWLTVIGVAPDMCLRGLTSEGQEGLFLPLAQQDREFLIIAARATANPLALTPVLRQQVAAIDQDLPIFLVQVMQQILDEDLYGSYVVSTLFVTFGLVGLALAAVGLFGVMAFLVRRRTTELGVRMALGARSEDVLLLTLRRGMRQVFIGMAAGLLLAAAAAQLLAVAGFKVDYTIFLVVALLVAGVGALACLAPAMRAARVDPLVALRSA